MPTSATSTLWLPRRCREPYGNQRH
jgi:hypothetical protein